jgi:hypothetical protein
LLPLAVLVGAYLYLAWQYQTWMLLPVVVHESGKYTLAQTILYYDHFIREVPICTFMAMATAAGGLYLTAAGPDNAGRLRRVGGWALAGSILVLAVAVTGAIVKNGIASLGLDLLQFRARDDLIAYGSHWYYHFLHLIFYFPATAGLVLLWRSLIGDDAARMPRLARQRRQTLLLAGLGAFVLLSLIFRPGSEAFTDTRFLAHQFREIVTHGTVTLPLSMAALLAVAAPRPAAADKPPAFRQEMLWRALLLLAGASLVPVYILLMLLGRDILAEAQRQSSYRDLFAAHYFEHMLDYVFVTALTLAFYSGFKHFIGSPKACDAS